MKPPTARQLARAITSTFESYRRGCMSRATWQKHALALWDRAAALGVEKKVRKLIEKGA